MPNKSNFFRKLRLNLLQHSSVVVSSVTPEQEGPRFEFICLPCLSMWSLHVLMQTMCCCFFLSTLASFIPQVKNFLCYLYLYKCILTNKLLDFI